MEKSFVKVKYTSELEAILKQMEEVNNYIAFELLWLAEDDSKYKNDLNISLVGISKKEWCFDVVINNNRQPMKVGKFVRHFLSKEIISDYDVYSFANSFNKIVKSANQDFGDPIKVGEFKYDPKNVESTFLSMVTKTYPHGHEEEVLKFLPNLKKDKVGNYYTIIGNSETMFTSHLDTADRKQANINLFAMTEKNEYFVVTDTNTILGADDKAGVTVMLYMMAHNIPGLYYFFIGEERGGIGSGKLSAIYDEVDYLKNIKRCVSFDRRNYHSVITNQLGRRCCSDEFGTALCKEYNATGLVDFSLDPTGIYTDSASFIDDISECTNISVGYFNEHTGDEYQNMTFLQSLCEASIQVNWESLPTIRKVGINSEILAKYKNFIKDIKESVFDLEVKITGDEGKVYLRIDMDEIDIESVHDTMSSVSFLLTKYKMDPEILFVGIYLKMELK